MRLAFAIVCLTASASAQPAPTLTSGPALLAHVQQHYAKVTNVKATIRYVHEEATTGVTTTMDGRGWVQRPSSYRFEFVKKKSGKHVSVVRSVFGDGTTEWTIDHIGQWYRASGPPSPFQIALQHITTPVWTYRSLVVAAVDTHLELTANAAAGAGYQSLTLVVDPTTGRVRGSTVVDDVGDTHRFMFFEPSYDATKPLAATMFQLAPSSAPKNYTKKP